MTVFDLFNECLWLLGKLCYVDQREQAFLVANNNELGAFRMHINCGYWLFASLLKVTVKLFCIPLIYKNKPIRCTDHQTDLTDSDASRPYILLTTLLQRLGDLF